MISATTRADKHKEKVERVVLYDPPNKYYRIVEISLSNNPEDINYIYSMEDKEAGGNHSQNEHGNMMSNSMNHDNEFSSEHNEYRN